MALVAKNMANAIISNVAKSTDPNDANSKFYKAVCDYVEGNIEIKYAWAGTNPMGAPDPVTVIQPKLKTSGSLTPSGATDVDSALAAFSATLNANALGWIIIWPSGFTLTPATIIPSISIGKSGKDNQQDAMESVCSDIIKGIKKATPSATGSHSAYVGTATFVEIK